MEAIFLKLLNISFTASYLVLAVALVRILFKKAPKWAICLLWGVVALRLICPFNIESIFSLIPNAEPIPQDILLSKAPAVNTGVAALDQVINPILSATSTPNIIDSINPLQVVAFVAGWIWVIGMAAMAIYALVSYIKIRWQVRESVRLYDRIWVSDRIRTPFILGLLRPRIYLPHALSENDTQYVLQHEKAHLKRLDHIWKPLGFALLMIYWFNPLLWVAYILLCRDIEMACDEKVLRQLGTEGKKPYADALINCSVPRRAIAACPLAFGEGDVKKRIRSILNYKKPAFWIIAAALVVCVCISVAFLTNPKTAVTGIFDQTSGSSINGIHARITEADLTSSDPYIELQVKNNSQERITCDPAIHLYQQVEEQWDFMLFAPTLDDPAMLAPGQAWVCRISLLCRPLHAQRYRLEITFYPSDQQIEDNSQWENVWVDFTLDRGVEQMSSTLLKCQQRIAWDDTLKRTLYSNGIPDFRLVSNSDGLWLHIRENDKDTVLGKLQKINLPVHKYDDRFYNAVWATGYDAKSLKYVEQEFHYGVIYDEEENKLVEIPVPVPPNHITISWSDAWELYYTNPETGEKELYMLLKRPQGDYYLCFGYYDQDVALRTPDHSYFTSVYSFYDIPNFSGGIYSYIVG